MTSMLRCLHAGLAIPLLASCAADTNFHDRAHIEATLPQLEEFIQTRLGQEIESLSMVIFDHGDIFYSRGFAVEVDTPLQAGSISKPVSAFAALALTERGVLALDEPLQTYVDGPYLPDPQAAAAITLRMVLNHTSGLGNDVTGADRAVYQPPGSEFRYSGGGFRYLQEAAVDTVEMAYDEIVAQEVFAVVDMAESAFTIEFNGQPIVNAAASLLAPPADIARFFAALASPDPAYADIVDLMTTPSVELSDAHSASLSSSSLSLSLSWGLGVGIYSAADGELLWHWGSNFGLHHSLAVVHRQSQIGMVVMATGEQAQESLRDIVHQAIGGSDYLYWDDVYRE